MAGKEDGSIGVGVGGGEGEGGKKYWRRKSFFEEQEGGGDVIGGRKYPEMLERRRVSVGGLGAGNDNNADVDMDGGADEVIPIKKQLELVPMIKLMWV